MAGIGWGSVFDIPAVIPSIDKRYEAFGTCGVDLVRLAEGLQERRLFHPDPEREGRGNRNKNDQHGDPIQPANSQSKKCHKRAEIRGVSHKAIGARVHYMMVAVNRNIDGKESAKIQDRVPTNDQTTAKRGESIYIQP